MYKKFLIAANKKNPAAMSITTALPQFRKNPILSSINQDSSFDFYFTEEEVLYEKNLDMPKIDKYDFIIFPCTHKSEKGEKSLSVHAPGNWRNAELGGEFGKVSRCSALFMKHIFIALYENAKKYELDQKYKITLEVTHHGPLINKPCLFIEIGSTEEEWQDRRVGFVIAKAISESIKTFKSNPNREIAIGIGGPHYCPNFNKIQLNSNIAISHIIPNYATPITEEMILEAIAKTDEEVDFVLLDWKGLGKAEERDRVISILEKNYIQWKKTSDVGK